MNDYKKVSKKQFYDYLREYEPGIDVYDIRSIGAYYYDFSNKPSLIGYREDVISKNKYTPKYYILK